MNNDPTENPDSPLILSGVLFNAAHTIKHQELSFVTEKLIESNEDKCEELENSKRIIHLSAFEFYALAMCAQAGIQLTKELFKE